MTSPHFLPADVVGRQAAREVTPEAKDASADPRARSRVRRIITAYSAFLLVTLSLLAGIGLWARHSRQLTTHRYWFQPRLRSRHPARLGDGVIPVGSSLLRAAGTVFALRSPDRVVNPRNYVVWHRRNF